MKMHMSIARRHRVGTFAQTPPPSASILELDVPASVRQAFAGFSYSAELSMHGKACGIG